jgi:hypothetical protein
MFCYKNINPKTKGDLIMKMFPSKICLIIMLGFALNWSASAVPIEIAAFGRVIEETIKDIKNPLRIIKRKFSKSKKKKESNSEPEQEPKPVAKVKESLSKSEKDWNFIVYMAANNNLHSFGIKNLQQMIRVGSNENVNILVQMDGYGQDKVCRYFVNKGSSILLSADDHGVNTTSGTHQSLFEFLKWAIQNYPAKKNAVVLWNHGTGIKDPSIWGKKIMLHRDELFSINYKTGLLELNRKIIHEDFEDSEESKTTEDDDDRGICFNDTYKTYITNRELFYVFNKLKTEVLGKNIEVVLMDACHMGSAEICSLLRPHVDLMSGSSEIVPGAGYNYSYLLEPFAHSNVSGRELVCHAVNTYRREYGTTHADFTQSAFKLDRFSEVEDKMKEVCRLLKQAIEEDIGFFRVIREIRNNKTYTTEFADPDYIDLCHLHTSLITKINSYVSANGQSIEENKILYNLRIELEHSIETIRSVVIQNTFGINVPHSSGVSVYFPQRYIHKSYFGTNFDQASGWSGFLQQYIRMMRA